MGDVTPNGAWIEWQDGGPVTLTDSCSIGRAPTNHVVLASDEVSRRHAVINREAAGEFQVLDLGSSNGTFLNGRRVSRSTPLRDGDTLQIGPFALRFRQPGEPAAAAEAAEAADERDRLGRTVPGPTMRHIKGAEYWLVLADLASSTALSQRLKPEEIPAVIGKWFEQCRDVIERHGGSIDNCLGDGFLACWPAAPAAAERVAGALGELTTIRDGGGLPFRVAVHCGDVFVGSVMASGAEQFFGPQINFIFKLERLASALGRGGLASEAAHERLEGRLHASPLGEHELSGFPGRFRLFAF